MKRLACVALVVLAACGGDDWKGYGIVTDVYRDDADTTLICTMYGKYGCTLWVLITDPERLMVEVDDSHDVEVSPDIYADCRIGSRWVLDGCASS